MCSLDDHSTDKASAHKILGLQWDFVDDSLRDANLFFLKAWLVG